MCLIAADDSLFAVGRVGSRLDFRILGPLEVRGADGVITITSRKQRALLVALLLDVGHAVSTDRLIDRLWNGGPPPQARGTLRSYISNLRRELDEAGAGAVLATRPNGYGLEVDPESVDVVRFERHVEDTRRALASGSPDEALRHADAGLALWRGEPLADAAYDDFAQSAIARLRELHLTLQEHRFDALLRLGRHKEAVAPLEEFVTAHPLRETVGRSRCSSAPGSSPHGHRLRLGSRCRLASDADHGVPHRFRSHDVAGRSDAAGVAHHRHRVHRRVRA